MKKRGLVISLLVLLAVITSGFTYAFWANTINVTDDTATGSITIGQGGTAETVVSVQNALEETDVFVPVGYEDTNAVSSVDFLFSVNWDASVVVGEEGAEGATGTLVASVTSVKTIYTTPSAVEYTWAFTDPTYGNMFTITLDYTAAITEGTPNTVTVTVVFTNEPASQAIYDQVANGLLQITIDFAVTPTA